MTTPRQFWRIVAASLTAGVVLALAALGLLLLGARR